MTSLLEFMAAFGSDALNNASDYRTNELYQTAG